MAIKRKNKAKLTPFGFLEEKQSEADPFWFFLEEFPAEIKEANVVIGIQVHEHQLETHTGAVSADEVKKINAESRNSNVLYLRIFAREPMKPGTLGVSCEELVYYKGAWIGPGNSIGRQMMDHR